MNRPPNFSPDHASAFQGRSVVEAYRHRPTYPPETFDILADLIVDSPRRVLDLGCGTGFLARHMPAFADAVDALDVSAEMIAEGKRLPNGDHPALNWIVGRAGFAKERMWVDDVAAFDQAVRDAVSQHAQGEVRLQVAAEVSWGRPLKP